MSFGLPAIPDIPLLVAIATFMLLAFVFEWMPIDVVALTTLGLLLLFDLVTPEEAISGFGNPAVIIVMMMFVLSYALTDTGLVLKLGNSIASLSGTSFYAAGIALLLTCGVLSAFMSNTATIAILMPVGIHLAKHFHVSPSRILLPLSYISIVGGTCTLIGTSTNLLVSSIAVQHDMPALGLFEFFGLGAILFVVGLIYLLIVPMHFMPDRGVTDSLTTKYRLANYLTELVVKENSKLVGKTVVDAHMSERYRLNVLEVIREGQVIATEIRNLVIQPGDRLIVRGAVDNILSFREQFRLLLPTDLKLSDEILSDENNILAELQISPVSRLTGQSIRQIDFRRRYGCFVLALDRTGETIRDKLTSIAIRQWDTLLVFGPRARVEALSQSDDFVSLEELEIRLRLKRRWWIGASVIPLVVVATLFGMPILKAAVLGVVFILATGRLTIQRAYKAINWTVIFLLAALLPLGIAMDNTGLSALLGEYIASVAGNSSPLVALSILYLTTALLSEVVSNNSTAVLMVPIAITASVALGFDAKPFIMAVAFGASASFLTPMGYQTNAMVFGPGSYKMSDYVKFGLPLKVTFWLISVALIPKFWPL